MLTYSISQDKIAFMDQYSYHINKGEATSLKVCLSSYNKPYIIYICALIIYLPE